MAMSLRTLLLRDLPVLQMNGAMCFYSANPQSLEENQQAALAYVSGYRMHSQQALQRKNFYADLMRNRLTLEADRQLRLKNLS